MDDETRRWGIEDLVHEIRKTQDSRHKFWCACCDEMYGRESELAAAVLQVDHEQILIEEDVKCWEWRLIGDQEKEHRSREHNIDRPRVAVSKTAVFLRRLLPMSADNWPAAKLEIKNLCEWCDKLNKSSSCPNGHLQTQGFRYLVFTLRSRSSRLENQYNLC